ncbi:MAG TPA: 5-bromo-4-chloroindolyl phosphate hydrolysis family protein [Spirochaetota bacterium]|nr:5-bromo-4-chloroindolyl phosphate hydrolysis family protein [Spirochaetota bacterium]HPV39860.1 5-bromo-4-chloroindolyl phosphate hydrolysis family protein [Spirochaetota bacterium]
MKRFFILFLVGTAIFAACWQFTVLGFLLSSVAGVAGMMLLGSALKLYDRTKRKREEGRPAPEKAAGDLVRDGMEKLRQISNTTRMIQSNDVAARIREFCKVGVEIFDYIKKNPGKINKVKQFTNYYLDATKKIIEQYVELSGRRDRTPEIEQALQKVEGMLDLIKQTFDRQMANLLEDNLLDINTELTVLKNTMKMEG